MTDISSTRLIKMNDTEYAYRPVYQHVRKVSAEYVEATYHKHFPHDTERNEEHMLLALDVETSTAYQP